jgi:hypothetical protein
MPRPSPIYLDGYASRARETTVLPMVSYPFSSSPIPDVRTQQLKRNYDIVPLAYTPRVALRTTVSNLLAYSEAMTAANGWTVTNLTPTLNAANPLDATTTAYTYLETVTNAAHSLGRAATPTAAQHTLSLFVKAVDRGFIRLQFTDSGATAYSGVFNISNGSVFAQTNAVASLIRVRDGFWRLMVTFTPAAGAGTVLFGFSTNGSTFSYAGDTAKGAIMWGSQMTLGGATVGYLNNVSTVTSRSAPDADTTNPFAWLVAETDPINVTSDTGLISRTFSQVPLTQVIPSSLLLTKPTLPLQADDQVVGDYYVNRPDSAVESYDAYLSQSIVTDSGAPTLYPTGGTYTLAFGADTTGAIAYNASAGTVQTALNALASITTYGGVTVTGAYNTAAGFTVAFTSIAAGSISTASLTSSSSATITSTVYEANSGMTKTFLVRASQPFLGYLFADTEALSPSNATISTAPIKSGPLGIAFVGSSAIDASDQLLIFGNNEIPTGGTFTLRYSGVSTGSITFDPSSLTTMASTIQTAINALSSVSARGSYQVTYLGIQNGNSYVFALVFIGLGVDGGTYTITLLSQTTAAIAYNASLTTVAAAINALVNVTAIGGVGVTGTSALNFSITFAALPTIAGNAGSLTVAPSTITVSPGSSVSRTQTIVFAAAAPPRLLSVPQHGISSGDTIFLATATTYYAAIAGGTAGGTFSVLNADTILLNVSADSVFITADPFTTIGRRTKSDYRPGTTGIRCLKTTAFYFPGVTYGVDDFGDVPLPENQSDAATFLAATFAGTGTLNWQVGEIMPWVGPILQQTTTTIDVADI